MNNTMNRRTEDSFQRDVLFQLGTIQALCATNAEANNGIKDRVKSLENGAVRLWWYNALILPVLGIAHSIAKKMGAI